MKGKVATWRDGIPVPMEVTLETNGNLENGRIAFTHLPPEVKPDALGCYCFDVSDSRFSYVHAFYYANLQVNEVNASLRSLGLPEVSGIKLSLTQNGPGSASVGSTDFDGKTISINYARPAIDVSILAHEIGHAVHMQVLGRPMTEIISFRDPNTLTLEETKLFGFQMGIVEGAAQLGSVLFNRDSKVGRYDWLDAANEQDRFVRFPDLIPTSSEHFTLWATAPKFSSAYPESADLARRILNNEYNIPYFQESLAWPYPYTASAAVIQPLIQAAERFERSSVMETHLAALSRLQTWRGYKDWAETLVKAAREPALRSFLEEEYTRRGLFTDTANP